MEVDAWKVAIMYTIRQILMILLSPCVISISCKLLLYRKVKLLPVALSYNKGKTADPWNPSDDFIDKVLPQHEYDPNRKYPNENLNVRKMYMLYTENYLESNISKRARVSLYI